MPNAGSTEMGTMDAFRAAGSLAHAVSQVIEGIDRPSRTFEVDGIVRGPIPARGVECGIMVRPNCQPRPDLSGEKGVLTLGDLQDALRRAADLLAGVERELPPLP